MAVFLTSPNVILTPGRLKKAVDYFLAQPAFSFDVESMGEHRGTPHLNTLSWISLATHGMTIVVPFGHPIGTRVAGHNKVPQQYKTGAKTGQTYYRKVPFYEDPPEQMTPGEVFEILEPLFFSPVIIKIAHNATFDLASIAKYYGGRPPLPPFDDTIVNTWLCDENRHKFGLKYVIRDFFGVQYDDEEVGRCVEKHPFDTVAAYAYLDARYCWLLWQHLRPQLEELELGEVHEIEAQLIGVLTDMRLTGATVDVPRLESLKDELAIRLEEIKGRVYKAAGKPFNINSNAQKQDLLYGPKSEGGQGLTPWKLTDGGRAKAKAGVPVTNRDYSTDDSVLVSFPGNKLARALSEYQETSKVLSTYVIGYLGDKDAPEKKPCRIFSDRIHADFVQYGTVSGRFSCREPNLQNIPRPDTELGKIIRGIWIAQRGYRLVVADFGQIELVVLAHYLGEGKLYEGFLAGVDPHRMTAAMVLGKTPDEVTSKERQNFGKSINFAVVYGAGLKKVASMAEVSEKEAKKFLNKHRQEFPEIYHYREYLLRKCRAQDPPHIRTLSGRMRRLPNINSRDEGLRMYSERQAFNSLVQGSAADIQKVAMLNAYDLIQRTLPEAALTMCVHDELVMTCPESRAQEGEQLLREAMTGPSVQSMVDVPLTVDTHIVQRWAEAK